MFRCFFSVCKLNMFVLIIVKYDIIEYNVRFMGLIVWDIDIIKLVLFLVIEVDCNILVLVKCYL